MKAKTGLLLLGYLLILGMVAINGCGNSASSTTTTTVNIPLSAARSGAILARGGSVFGTTVNQMTGAGNIGVAMINSIRAAGAAQPPESFFAIDLSTLEGDNVYIPLTSEAVSGNMALYLRQLDRSGRPVNGSAIFAGRKIAIMGTYEVRDLMTGEPGVFVPQMEAGKNSFTMEVGAAVAAGQDPYASAECFRPIRTLADYNAWASDWFGMQDSVKDIFLSTPQADLNTEGIGTIEGKMVFSRNLSGTISILLTTKSSTDSGPMPGTYSNSGVITIPGGTMNVTASLVFVGSEINGGFDLVTFEGISLSGVTTPDGLRVSGTMDPYVGLGQGIISNEALETIGTYEFDATGGKLYLTGSAVQPFSY